jgi:light-harvesting complex I chlorophyll a/b binding protein 1
MHVSKSILHSYLHTTQLTLIHHHHLVVIFFETTCNLIDSVDLKYARWSELKHGRIAMLAIVGMVVQSSGIHLPGEAYTNSNPLEAPATVGYAVNLQIFLAMCMVEIATFNATYGEGTPGDLGWNTPNLIANLSPADLKKRQESEIVHCRLAMIAITGAVVQYLLYGKLGL